MKISPKPGANGSVGSLAVPNRTSLTLNTGSLKSPAMQKLDAIKQRFSGAQEDKTPVNKQGQAIPPQPSGINVAGTLQSEANSTQSSNSEALKVPGEAIAKPVNPQMQLLARQQQALRKAQRELEAEKAAWKQEQAKFLSRDQLTADPLKVLSEAGISQDRLVELQLNQSTPPTETQLLQQKIAELEKKLNGVDETFKSRDKQAYDQAVLAIKRDAELLVSSDPAYETLKALGSEGTNEVVEYIKKRFAQDGTVLDVEVAAKEIEELALEREYARVQKFTQLSKLKEKLAPVTPDSQATAEAQVKQGTASKQPPTLTNQMGVSRPLTAREKAILAFTEAAKKQSF